ncbi:MAG TPA: PAS domain S-box protein, partial [Chitinophagaceae bacterium]|nr:PAS domain S-box protein [Chitinophagaceae bacterium]
KTVFRLDPQVLQNDQYSWDNRIHPDDLQAVLTSLQESMNDSMRQYWIQEYRFLNGSNEYAYVRDKAIILRDDTGKANRMIGAMQDITALKEAEIRLTYERNMMRAIIDNIPDYIYVKDREYRHLVNNKAMVQLLGCQNEADSLGKTLAAFFPPEVAKQYLDDDALVIKSEEPVYNREEYTINPKGEKEWILTTKVPLRNEAGEVTGLVGITRNVSFIYKQQQEEKLIYEIIASIGKNESFSIALANTIRLLAESLGFRLGEAWVMNLSETELVRRAFWMKGQTGEPHPFQQSDRMEPGTGLPGKCWSTGEILVWNDISNADLFLRREATSTMGLHSAIGIPVQFNNEMIAVLLFMSEKNINDQKDSIRMLQRIALQVGVDLKRKKTEDELNRFFNYAPELMCIVAPDGYFKKVNPAFSKVLGYTEQELLSQPFFNFVHPDDRDNTVIELKDATGGQMAISFENRYKTKSGQWRWISWSSSAPLDEEGLVFGYGKDVTLTKEAELNLQKFRQVIESSRDGIGIISLTGDEPFMNKAFMDMLEYSPEELASFESALSIYVDPDLGKEMFDCLYNGQYWKGDIQLKSKSGRIIDFYLSGGPIFNEKNEVVAVYGLHTNISQRKQLERDLLDYNIRINTILESITDGFFSVDNNWIVTYWNKEAERILLTPRESIIGKNLWDKFGEAMPLKFFSEYNRAVNEEVSVHFEEFFGPLNAWFEVSAYPSTNGLSVYFKDVTERNKADEALKLSNERYAIVAQATNDSIWDWNLETNEVYRPGKRLESSWGYENVEAALVDDFWSSHVHPDDWHALNKRRKAILEDPRLNYWDDEYRFVRPDGSYAYVYDRAYILRDDEGRAVRLIGASRDISNEKEQVNEIQRIRQNLEALINTTTDMIWSVNTELQIITCNKAHQSLTGKLAGTQLMEGDNVISGFGEVEAKKWEAYYRRCLKGSQFSVNESFFDPVLGKLNYTIVSFSPMRDKDGAVYGAACYAKDVTDLANSTIQLEELNKKLQKQAAELANSNRELEQFAFVASHDLQEPLRMVSSFLELIDKKYNALLDE